MLSSLYIDVDTDSHGVVSLNGEEDVVREYMMSTGMLSSLYESTVWEEMTEHESISTISILAQAQENNIEILVIAKENLSAELEKLNTDEATKQSVINAVNSGMIVTIPAEEITMGQWQGTGYMVTNPETGAGEYIISGGLNGGSTCDPIDAGFIVSEMYLMWSLEAAVESMVAVVEMLCYELLFGSTVWMGMACICLLNSMRDVINACNHLTNIMRLYYDYILDDSEENTKAFLVELKSIFMDGFFENLATDGAEESLKWIYKWYINGGYLY